MTDRELLELAAKVAGLVNPRYQLSNGWAQTGVLHDENSGRDTHLWNPLADDGDALRLAVTLGLSLITEPFFVRVYSIKGAFLAREEVLCDGFAATRRAIVRAAAAIGKATP